MQQSHLSHFLPVPFLFIFNILLFFSPNRDPNRDSNPDSNPDLYPVMTIGISK